MNIDKASLEDLTYLRLLVDKLEEQMLNKGIKYFDHSRSQENITNVLSDREEDAWSHSDGEKHEAKLKPIKRVKVKYHSKAIFYDVFSFDKPRIKDNDELIASSLTIEWDHFTNVFLVIVGHETYEKPDPARPDKLRRADNKTATINFDFKSEYRREIIIIKTRLGKLYKQILRDKELERTTFYRKTLADITMEAFPDFMDSLLLGGFSGEKGNG